MRGRKNKARRVPVWGKPQTADRDTGPSAIWTVCSLHQRAAPTRLCRSSSTPFEFHSIPGKEVMPTPLFSPFTSFLPSPAHLSIFLLRPVAI